MHFEEPDLVYTVNRAAFSSTSGVSAAEEQPRPSNKAAFQLWSLQASAAAASFMQLLFESVVLFSNIFK